MTSLARSPFALPKGLNSKKNTALLTGVLRGIEREALRTDPHGHLARSPHPRELGSALTHPQITTDFSESLLELITPPSHTSEDLFVHLETFQKFVASNLGNELIWNASMPCILGRDDSIPVALYGNSNNGLMKTVYRLGLGHRYGRAMQTIAGIHYNFSLPDAFWAWLLTREHSLEDLQSFKDRKYFGLIRNFRRYFWLLIYLFGASPACCRSFVANRAHDLETLPNSMDTLYKPWATSLRMGDLGYQSSAQQGLYVCYNAGPSYIKSLCQAITTPYADYANIGVKDSAGAYRQLNTSILQIENEFYSAIRPKRTANPGETALTALSRRGVEYIEVRCLDIDPFSPLGISREQVHFLDVFLLYCCLKDSPETTPEEATIVLRNQKKVVNEGRASHLQLTDVDGSKIPLCDWATALLHEMAPVAELLDEAHAPNSTSRHFQEALEQQQKKIEDPENTPSAKILRDLRHSKLDFSAYALALSKQHLSELTSEKLPRQVIQRFNKISALSIKEQTRLEARSHFDFNTFLQKYYAQYTNCCA